VFEDVSQSNSRFNALDTLTIEVHSVRMPLGFRYVKAKGRPLQVIAHLKKSTMEVKTEANCLAHALIVAIAKLSKDPDYKAYIQGRKIHHVVDNLIATIGISGGSIPELERFHDHFSQYKIVVYTGLNCESVMFEGHVETSERLNLLYDVTRHYHVIGSMTGAMVRQFVCKACGKGCLREMHTCDQTCSDCMVGHPCVQAGVLIPCVYCNRHFRSQTCFVNHKLKRGARRVFVSASASADYVTISSILPENMNEANNIAKHVKPVKR
jgi:hypothetical protein